MGQNMMKAELSNSEIAMVGGACSHQPDPCAQQPEPAHRPDAPVVSTLPAFPPFMTSNMANQMVGNFGGNMQSYMANGMASGAAREPAYPTGC